VARTGSRAEALAVVEQRAGADGSGTDLVICDVGLPDGSGVELMRELIARHGLSGIALTGYGMGSDVRASLEAGFLAHFTKPVDIRALREAIQSLRAER
jgi:CheY-like chemotaxis protein